MHQTNNGKLLGIKKTQLERQKLNYDFKQIEEQKILTQQQIDNLSNDINGIKILLQQLVQKSARLETQVERNKKQYQSIQREELPVMKAYIQQLDRKIKHLQQTKMNIFNLSNLEQDIPMFLLGISIICTLAIGGAYLWANNNQSNENSSMRSPCCLS